MTEEENFETEQQIQRLLWEEYRKRDHSDSKRIRKRRRGRSQEPIAQQRKAQKQPNADAEQECTICLETIGGRRKTLALECGHTFHKTCITKARKYDNHCPVCRN